MNNYRRRTYSRKRSYSSRHRRSQEPYHQPLPPDQSVIPSYRHTLTKPDVEAVVDALLSGTLTNGAERERFESLLSKLTHSRFAISTNSGTAAIHAALARLNLEPEDEVITSTLNHPAVANMTQVVGAKLVLVDCDPDTLTINVDATREAITSKTKVIFANNFAGHPADMAVLRELCNDHSLRLLDDAGHGLGGKYRGHYVGNQADLTCFSFNPSKAVTTCEGGAVTTDNVENADWLRMFRDLGRQRSPKAFKLETEKPSYYQEVQAAGFNYRMSELHAALGRSQLTRLERHIERRRVIAKFYNQKLSATAEVILPFVADWAQHAFHAYPLQLSGQLFGKRDEIYNTLTAEGIDIRIHYIPIHRMPFFKGRVGDASNFPNAEAYYHNCLSLPLFPDLSIKDLERITDALLRVITKIIKTRSEFVTSSNADAATVEAAAQGSVDESPEREDKAAESDKAKPDDERETPEAEKPKAKTRRRKPATRKRKPKKQEPTDQVADTESRPPEAEKKSESTPDVDEEVSQLQKSAGKLRIIPKEEESTDKADETDQEAERDPADIVDQEDAAKPKKATRARTTKKKETTKSDASKKAAKTTRTRKTTTRKPRTTKTTAKKAEKAPTKSEPSKSRQKKTPKTTTDEGEEKSSQ